MRDPVVHVCDFGAGCDPPAWLFGCAQFVVLIAGRKHTSVGGWFACDACAQLVDADDWHGLIERAFTSGNMRRVDPQVRRALVKWYSAFWRNRDGTKTPITEEHLRNAVTLREELLEDE